MEKLQWETGIQGFISALLAAHVPRTVASFPLRLRGLWAGARHLFSSTLRGSALPLTRTPGALAQAPGLAQGRSGCSRRPVQPLGVTASAHEGPSAPTGARRASSVLPTPSGSRASLQRGAAAPFSVCGD